MSGDRNDGNIHWGPRIGMPQPKPLSFVEALDIGRQYAKDLNGVTQTMVIRALMDGLNAAYRGEIPEAPNWEDFKTN